MGTLKGQNLRMLILDSTSSKYKCVGLATSCNITLTGNADDTQTKDDVGLANKPSITSKSWQVSVESLNVSDVGAMLTAVKNMTPFTLMWDEVSTTDNQSLETNDFQRIGQAYLSDFTATFNDRENSVKQLQFSGSGAIEHDTQVAGETISVGSYTKGQFVRLFLSSDNTATPAAVIAACKQMSMHVSITMEDSTTKDTAGDWLVQEPTALSYDISTTALVRSGETITSAVAGKTLADLETIYETGNPVKWLIANVSGANNRTKGSVIVSGSCIISQLQIQAAVKTNATYQASLTGYGNYTVGA